MYDVSTGGDHGFLFDDGKFKKLPDPDLTKYDTTPDWNGLNAEGEIVGIVTRKSGGNDAFILENGVYNQAPAPYDELEFNGINDREAVVGEVSLASVSHGVLFKGRKFYVFDFPGAIDTIAFDINNIGDIAGAYTTADFIDHGFILKGFPEHPKWFTVDNGNPTYPDTTIRTINDQGVIGGVLSTGGRGPHTEVGFVAEPKHHY